MFSCGLIVDKLSKRLGKKCVQSSTGRLSFVLSQDSAVDKHSMSPQLVAQNLRSLSTAKIGYFVSVTSSVIPSFHSPYYYQDELKII